MELESYHSSLNDVSGIETLAPALCERLGLVNRGLTFDLWDRAGRQATVYREFDVSARDTRSSLLYLRTDLLEQYLTLTGQLLVWIAWGERTLNVKLFADHRELPEDVQTAMQGQQSAFGELIDYEATT